MTSSKQEGSTRSVTGRNSFLYLLGALLQGLGIVFVQPFAIRVLDNDVQWSELILSVSIIQVGVVLAAAGLPLAITRAWFDAEDGPGRARSISGFLSISGLLLGFSAAGIALLVATATGAEPVSAFTIALATLGVLASVLAAQAILRAQERPIAFMLLSLGTSVGAHGCGLLAITLFEPRAVVYLAGFALAVAVTAVAACAVAPPTSPFAVPGAVREGLAIGLPVLPHTGALMLLTQGAVFLLAITAGKVPSGDYGKVQIFILGAITLLGALNNAWVPAIMSATQAERDATVRHTMVTASYAGLAVVVVASGGANVVTHIIAGSSELVPVAQIMPLVSIGYLLYLNATTILFADKKTGWLAVVTPVVLVVGSLIALAPAFAGNLEGVAVANAVAFLVLGLAYYGLARRRAPGGWPVKVYVLCGAASVAYVLVLLQLPQDLGTGIATVGVLALMGAGGLAAFAYNRRQRVS